MTLPRAKAEISSTSLGVPRTVRHSRRPSTSSVKQDVVKLWRPAKIEPSPARSFRSRLRQVIASKLHSQRPDATGYGGLAGTWPYRHADGQLVFYVCRYEAENVRKSVIPWYFGKDDSWHPGQPMATGRPLFRLPELLNSQSAVLVVEGEKCATVQVPEGFPFFVTTWSGGALAVARLTGIRLSIGKWWSGLMPMSLAVKPLLR